MTNETTAAAEQAHDPEDDLPEQMRIRRDKRERLAELGIEPYPVGVPVTTTIQAVRAEHGHRRLGVRHDALSEWTHAAGLKLDAPRSFDPPAPDAPGLTVNIWQAIKPAIAKARAA